MSKACKQAGMDRTSFYEWKRRFQTHGLEGLKDLPPIAKNHPQTTPEATVERIVELSMEPPTKGCNYLSALLAQEGIVVSFVTVQNILTKHGLSNREIELTAEQIKAIEQANPQFKERHVESCRPGELLSQDTFYVGQFKGVGKVYLQTVVDTFGSYAFGVLGTSKKPEGAVSILYNDVLPFYEEKQIDSGAVLTDNGRAFCGKELQHPYELFLALNDSEHRRTKVRRPQTNGFVERFHRTVLDAFFRVKLRTTFYESVEALQADLDEWLVFYNEERPHLGYRNMGRRPLDTLCLFLQGKEAGEVLATFGKTEDNINAKQEG